LFFLTGLLFFNHSIEEQVRKRGLPPLIGHPSKAI